VHTQANTNSGGTEVKDNLSTPYSHHDIAFYNTGTTTDNISIRPQGIMWE